MRRGIRRVVFCVVSTAVLLAAAPGSVVAFPDKLAENGKLDFTYGVTVKEAGGPGTAYKPESKLFYTGKAGEPLRWWAVLGTSGPSPAAGVWLFKLEDHDWDPEILLPGADPWAKADVEFAGGMLTISLRDNQDTLGSNPKQSTLYSMPYLGSDDWGPIVGPTAITTNSPETLTIARDSVGRVWTTYESGGKIRVGYTAPFGTSFTFFTLSQTNVQGDDISSVSAFGGNRIGVFWSDQNSRRHLFAWRSDTDAVDAAWHHETAYGNGVGGCPTSTSPLCADDHINIKVYQGKIFVAVKSSLNDAPSPAPGDPLISLLRRSTGGVWSASTVATVSQNVTRPVVILSPSQSKIWVWGTRGSEVDVWESSFSSPSFTSTAFVPWVKGVKANDATTTKQVTTLQSGVVVEVSVTARNQYWHNEFLPAG